VVGIARPHDADLEALHFGESRAPLLRRIGGRAQIGNRGRDGFEPRFESARQAQQHGVALIGRRIAAVAENGDARQALAQQSHELLVHAQRDFSAARGKQRHVACKLQRIAEPLLGLDINVLAGEILALPRNLGKFWAFAFGRAQAPLVFIPAFGEIAAHQQENAESGPRIGVVRRQRYGAAQHRNALFEAAAVVQRGAEIGPGVGVIGIDLNGAPIGDDRFVEAPQRMQRVAEIAMRLGEIGIGRDRLALGLGGFFVIFELVQRDAEIAQRRGHRRLDLDRCARRVGGELGPAGKAEHFAEIGVKQCHPRRELRRPLHVLDGIAELAVLVADDAEQMLGLRDVRLRLEDLAAHRLRLHQAALVAAALGMHQGFAERQNSRVRLGFGHDRLD
jgi:hypothetical protein